MSYVPKPHTQWRRASDEEGDTWIYDVGDERPLFVTVEGTTFTISRCNTQLIHCAPSFGDIGQVERDFGVHGWTSIKLVDLTQTPDKGEVLLIEAMELNDPRPN